MSAAPVPRVPAVPDVPEVKTALLGAFRHYVEPYLRRHFHTLRLARTEAAIDAFAKRFVVSPDALARTMKREERGREKAPAVFAGGADLPKGLLPRPPELSSIEVVMPRPKPVAPEELVQRFEQLRYELASRKPLRRPERRS